MEEDIGFLDKGRIFTLLSRRIPLNREELMKIVDLKDKESFRRFMKKLEDRGIIKRFHKNDRVNVYFVFTEKFLKSINTNKQYSFNFVYRLYKDKEIVYIGKTNNLKYRIKAHKKDKEFDYYDYAITSDSEAHVYEVYYINKYRPILNKDCKGEELFNIKVKELEFISEPM